MIYLNDRYILEDEIDIFRTVYIGNVFHRIDRLITKKIRLEHERVVNENWSDETQYRLAFHSVF